MKVLMLVMAILWGSVSTVLAESDAPMDVAGVGNSGGPAVLAHIVESSSLQPLPAGAVKPKGWLRDWCETARDGYIGHLDEIDEHFRIAWTTNCMRRGKFLSWTNAHKGSWSAEGGAYWFDGLVRLAWQLDDPALKDYVKRRLDTVLDRMNPSAITFVHWMDRRDPEQLREVTEHNEAWIGWASALLGRAIAAYYQASGDPRALRSLNWAFNDVRFFEFGNGKSVPSAAWETYRLGSDVTVGAALDEWCAKGPDFNHVVWRYAKGVEPMEFRPFTQKQRDWRAQHGVLACETAISALRVSYWRNGRREWRENVLKWSDYIRANCLQPHGVPVADESWGYTGPDRGTETCTVAADIRLNIEMLSLLGRSVYGDRVERAVFNAGAACTTADFFKHVYVQTPNRTVVENRSDFTCPVSARYYLRKNWPLCCTAALARYIPDFTQHLWMKSLDGGLVATMYAPNELDAKLEDVHVRISTETDYPFGERLKLQVDPDAPCAFPLRLRMPDWCASPVVEVNGVEMPAAKNDGFVRISRVWKSGDAVVLNFPMKPFVTTGRDRNKGEPGNAWCSISAGPVLFALNLPGEDANKIRKGTKTSYRLDPERVAREAVMQYRPMPGKWQWTPEVSPVSIRVPSDSGEITLVPYGSTDLRVSMFDVAELPRFDLRWHHRFVFDLERMLTAGYTFLPTAHYSATVEKLPAEMRFEKGGETVVRFDAPTNVAPPYVMHLMVNGAHKPSVFVTKDRGTSLAYIANWSKDFEPRSAALTNTLRLAVSDGMRDPKVSLSAGIGQADTRFVTWGRTNRPYVEDGRLFFTFSARAYGAYLGVMSFNPDKCDFRLEGVILFDYGDGLLRNDLAADLFYDDEAREWRAYVSNFSTGADSLSGRAKGGINVAWSKDCPLHGVSVMRAKSLGLDGMNEDPDGYWDAEAGKWRLLVSEFTTRGIHASLLESESWDGPFRRVAGPVAEDSTGTTLAVVDGWLRALSGSADHAFHVYTYPTLEKVGKLDVLRPTWEISPSDNGRSWPAYAELADGRRILLTFDRVNFEGMSVPNWTYGGLYLYENASAGKMCKESVRLAGAGPAGGM